MIKQHGCIVDKGLWHDDCGGVKSLPSPSEGDTGSPYELIFHEEVWVLRFFGSLAVHQIASGSPIVFVLTCESI